MLIEIHKDCDPSHHRNVTSAYFRSFLLIVFHYIYCVLIIFLSYHVNVDRDVDDLHSEDKLDADESNPPERELVVELGDLQHYGFVIGVV